MVAFKLQRTSGGGSGLQKGDRLKGDPRLLGRLSFPEGNYLVATPVGYDSMKLTFLVPSAFLGYTRLAVVRSNYGFPINKHDGVTVFEYPNTATPVSQTFIDNNFGRGLVQGQFYYYTLFAKMPNSVPNWNQVDTDFDVVTKDFGNGSYLWNLLPGFFRQADSQTFQRNLPYTVGGQLQRFCDLLGYELDVIRTDAETLLDVNNPADMASTLLYLQGYDLSLDPGESSIGDARFRAMVQDAIFMRENKGSVLGITDYVRSLTDYDVVFLPLRNLMRSVAEARFQEGYGAPGTTLTTSTWQRYIAGINDTNSGPNGSGAAWSPVASPVSYNQIQGNYYIQLGGFSGTPTIQLRLWGSTAAYGANQLNTSPVADVLANAVIVPQTGITYTLSWIGTLYLGSPANVTITSCNVIFYWFDANGVFISSDSHAATIGSTNTVANAHGNQAFESVVSNAAPANAAYVGFAFVFALSTSSPGSNNSQYWWSGFKFEKTSVANNVYIDPHAAEINVLAQRVNLVQNPSAEVDNTLWSLLNLTSFTSSANALATAGARLFSIVCNGAGNARITTSTFMLVNTKYVYSMRFDAEVPNTSIGINAIIIWYDGAATPNIIRTDTLNFPAPLPTTVMRGYDFGNVVPPATAVQAKVAIEFTGVVAGNTVLVDAVLFGPGPPMWYFDGDTQDGLDTPTGITPSQFSDFGWFGTQGKSTSFFYNNYYIAMKRLRADIPNWVPAGGTGITFYTPIAP